MYTMYSVFWANKDACLLNFADKVQSGKENYHTILHFKNIINERHMIITVKYIE